MISYQWENQKIIKKIRDSLQENGVKCWMDIYDMQGSTTDAMAQAVQGAEIVLICYSKKYQDSSSCRMGIILLIIFKKSYLIQIGIQNH